MTMAPKIYKSTYPDVHIPDQSIFTHIFPPNDQFDRNLPAFIDVQTDCTVTRGELRENSLRFAAGLVGPKQVLAAHGGPSLARGDVISIYSPNSLSFALALYGSFAAGVKVSPVNSGYTPSELAYQLVNCQAKAVVVHPALLTNLLEAYKGMNIPEHEAKKRIILGTWNETFESLPTGYVHLADLLTVGLLDREAIFDGRYAHETVLMCYSSGTTGLAKGVETTHKNLVSIMSMFPAVFMKMTPGEDKMLGFLPAYHIYGMVKVLLYPLSQGCPAVIIRGFDLKMFGAALSKHKTTILPMIPPVILLIAKNPIFDKFDFTNVKLITSGAAPLGPELTREVVHRLQKLGSKAVVVQGYGLTETSPTATYTPAQYWDSKAGSIGPLLPNLEARLVRDDGTDAPTGERGELWLRGPSIMKGYLHNATATFDSITPDNWFQTGDIAVRSEDGFFTIVDRKKELIKYKGFQVPPADLEAVLLSHPDVVDSGVIGIYSRKQETELPRAYVVPKAGYASFKTHHERETFAQDIAKWITSKVAKHKYLRGGVVVVEAIPKSAAGKILRKELREQAKKELEAEGERERANL